MAVALPNAPILAVDEEFGPLVPRDLTSGVDRFRLRLVHRRGPLIPGPSNGPAAMMRNNMLVATHPRIPSMSVHLFYSI